MLQQFHFFKLILLALNFYNKFKPTSQLFYTKKRFQRMSNDDKSFVTYQIKCLLLFYLFQKKIAIHTVYRISKFFIFTPVDCTLEILQYIKFFEKFIEKLF